MPEMVVAELIENEEAILNISWQGQNGDLPNPILFDSTPEDVRRWATEAVRGGIPGIAADANVNFQDFVVERFPSKDGLPNRVLLRGKTAFGGQ